MTERADDLFSAFSRAILFAAGIWLLVWFLGKIQGVALLFVFALVLAIALNAPVTWLEKRRLPRLGAVLLVCLVVALLIGGLGWLIGPRLANEVVRLAASLPEYAQSLTDRLATSLEAYPELQRRIRLNDEALAQLGPWILNLAQQLWRYALGLLFAVVLALVLVSLVVYMLLSPQPLLESYIRAIPVEFRDPATRAFTRSSQMVVGWMWSNVIAGTIEAVAVFLFLSFMQIPGALIWSVFAFFAELVPKLGIYLMAIPPVAVALSVDPIDALWVVVFYWGMSEVMGDLGMPRVRRSTMNLHPVYSLFVTLALAAAFGLPGALVATPVAAFLKAYYEEFYLVRRPPDPHSRTRVRGMLERRAG